MSQSNRPAHLTPSQFKRIMTSGRGKDERFGKTAFSYADEVVMRLIGVEEDEIITYAMQWGIDHEPDAAFAYQERYEFAEVHGRNERIVHPEHDFISGEPDALVGIDGGLEIKCPNSNNHLSNIIEAGQLPDYEYQIQGYMWITGREWWDFASYDPRFPRPYRLHVTRVGRDEGIIAELEDRCIEFWDIVQGRLERIEEVVAA